MTSPFPAWLASWFPWSWCVSRYWSLPWIWGLHARWSGLPGPHPLCWDNQSQPVLLSVPRNIKHSYWLKVALQLITWWGPTCRWCSYEPSCPWRCRGGRVFGSWSWMKKRTLIIAQTQRVWECECVTSECCVPAQKVKFLWEVPSQSPAPLAFPHPYA